MAFCHTIVLVYHAGGNVLFFYTTLFFVTSTARELFDFEMPVNRIREPETEISRSFDPACELVEILITVRRKHMTCA